MRCTLVVESGKERSQRSCELPAKLTTREEVVSFLRSQDLRLEAADFDYTVRFDGTDHRHTLKTDADVRLFLAQARQLCDAITFNIHLSTGASAAPDVESMLSLSYAVDLDLVTLHVYPPVALAASPSQPPPSPSSDFHVKTFVVPTRFVLDSLARAVRDTVPSGVIKRSTKLTLYSLASASDRDGTALLSDEAALQCLHDHARRRVPLLLTYALQHSESPTSRRPSVPSASPSQQQQETAEVKEVKDVREEDKALAEEAPPAAPRRPTVTATLPPLSPSDVQVPAAAPLDATPTAGASSNAAQAPPSARSAAPQPPASSSPHTPFRAHLRSPVSPSGTAEVAVEVRTAEQQQPAQAFTFAYIKSELQLSRRFTAECAARCAAKGAVVLTLSSDDAVVIDSDGVLRELLALAREARQPLRVRLHAAPHPLASAEKTEKERETPPSAARRPNASVVPPRKPSSGDSGRASVTSVRRGSSSTVSPTQTKAADPPNPSPPSPPLQQLVAREESAAETPEAAAAAPTNSDTASAAAPPPASPRPATLESVKSTATDSEGPSPVASTAPGPPLAPPHMCLLPSASDAAVHRLQIATWWSGVRRITMGRVGHRTLLRDLQRSVCGAYAELLAGGGGEVDWSQCSMEVVAARRGEAEAVVVPITEATTVDDILSSLCLESSELRVLAPPLPLSTSAQPPQAKDAAVGVAASEIVAALAHSGAPLTPQEICRLLRPLLGTAAAVEPLSGFVSALSATPLTLCDAPVTDDARSGGVDKAARLQDVQRWMEGVLAGLPLSDEQRNDVVQSVAAGLLSGRLCSPCRLTADYLDGIHAMVRAAAGTPGSTEALHALWAQARSEQTPPAESRGCCTALPTTVEGWRAAFTAAPALVLQFTAAAHMDGLLHAPAAARSELPDKAVDDAFHRAQLRICEGIVPAELEAYFQAGASDEAGGDGDRLCRSLVLCAVGALLSPAPPPGGYAEWASEHFRGRVGAALYAKMAAFSGQTALSLPLLCQLCWALLDPAMPSIWRTSTQPALAEKLATWACVATAHACHARRLSFPLAPLLSVHTSPPVPLCCLAAPPPSSGVVETAAAAAGVEDAEGCAAGDTAPPPRAPLSPSPPPPLSDGPASGKTPKKKVQYVYRYNFNALRRPRSSAS